MLKAALSLLLVGGGGEIGYEQIQNNNLLNVGIIIIDTSHLYRHRRRKMLKVGWAQYPVVRKIFMTTPTL